MAHNLGYSRGDYLRVNDRRLTDGSLGDIVVESLTADTIVATTFDLPATIQVDTINEETPANGVIIETVVVKDGGITLATGATCNAILDEDAMGTDSATALATQQSIKAYTDAHSASAGASHTYINQDVTSTGTPSFNALDINLPNDDNITVDGRSDPRTVTVGVFRINHTPAVISTRCIHLDIAPTGFDDTRGLTVAHDLTGSSSAINPQGIIVNADITGTTNAHLDFFKAVKAGDVGSGMTLHMMDCEIGIDPIHHVSGGLIAVENAKNI